MSQPVFRLTTIVGARPQFVKAAAIERAIQRLRDRTGVAIESELVHTGQHYDHEMSQAFFEGLDLSPAAHHLEVGSAPHGRQTGEMLIRLEPILKAADPDVVIVHGDTNSTLAGALVAAKLHLPVAHVEAGLRSYDRAMPEEVNRILTDHASTHLFAPTTTAVDNLRREGIEGAMHSGDVMYDVLKEAAPKAIQRTDVLSELGVRPGTYALATIHRAANTDDPARLSSILDGLARVALQQPVALPLHPRTREALRDVQVGDGIQLVAPVGYEEMLCLEHHARVILTDSGGVQKEAYWLGVPCVTLREETEWPETLEGGWNMLVGADPSAIESAATRPVPDAPPEPSFGDGQAAEAIVGALVEAAGR